jgi:hypothetical protein
MRAIDLPRLHNSNRQNHITTMRRILPFLMLTAVAACSLPQTRWEKDGADEKMAMGDLGYCKMAARNEAFTTYPYGFGSPFYGFRRYPASWAWDNDRYYAENRLTSFCMRAKGYQQVTVQPAQPQTQPPQAPPAAEK